MACFGTKTGPSNGSKQADRGSNFKGKVVQQPFSSGVGHVLSADIAVPDHDRELEFYAAILTTGETPFWRQDLMNNMGTPVIGLGVRTPEYSELPLHWMPHFQVADIATSMACAVKLGGKELLRSKADDVSCQWGVATDPFGAAFGVVPVAADDSDCAGQNMQSGRICGLTMIVADAAASSDFYQNVVGWGSRPLQPLNGTGRLEGFEMLRDNGTQAAEIFHSEKVFKDVPAAWLIHLPVADLAESLRRIENRGGEVIQKYSAARKLHTDYAIVKDPVGVYLVLQTG